MYLPHLEMSNETRQNDQVLASRLTPRKRDKTSYISVVATAHLPKSKIAGTHKRNYLGI
jgi:hypothetical protein